MCCFAQELITRSVLPFFLSIGWLVLVSIDWEFILGVWLREGCLFVTLLLHYYLCLFPILKK